MLKDTSQSSRVKIDQSRIDRLARLDRFRGLSWRQVSRRLFADNLPQTVCCLLAVNYTKFAASLLHTVSGKFAVSWKFHMQMSLLQVEIWKLAASLRLTTVCGKCSLLQVEINILISTCSKLICMWNFQLAVSLPLTIFNMGALLSPFSYGMFITITCMTPPPRLLQLWLCQLFVAQRRVNYMLRAFSVSDHQSP